MRASAAEHVLRPLDFLHRDQEASMGRMSRALIILNQPIEDDALLEVLWKNTSYHICADGGANRLFEATTRNEEKSTSLIPDAIHGDLDSLAPEVASHYRHHGVEITRDGDQYSTDFEKACKMVHAWDVARHTAADPDKSSDDSSHDRHVLTDIVVLGGIAGRVDQGLGLLSELLREQTRIWPHGSARPCSSPPYETSAQSATPLASENATGLLSRRYWLFSEQSISFVLESGTSVIDCSALFPVTPQPHSRVDLDRAESGPVTRNVGLIPLYGPARLVTTGLEWNLDGTQESRMGGLVSSSNHIVERSVRVSTDQMVLCTIERSLSIS